MQFSKKHLLVGLLSFVSVSIHAEVKEISSFAEFIDLPTKDDLVVFDIDNTILKPSQTLGSDQWFDYVVKSNVADGLPRDAAIDNAISKWQRVQQLTGVTTTEVNTAAWIRGLKERGVRIMALTARPRSLGEASFRQLASVGINFSSKWIDDLSGFTNDRAVAITSGLLLVGPKNNKGQVFTELFEHLRTKPRRLYFVDDKERHVKAMATAAEALNVEFFGYRFSAEDANVTNFNPNLADKQWQVFESQHLILSDRDYSVSNN